MKNRMLVALSAAAAAAFLCLSARAEIAEEPLVNPADETDVWGKKITGLGAGDETALVFTKTGATMSWTLPEGVKSIRYLVVGGGGGGGACFGNSYSGGGGGGAGGLLTDTMVVEANAQLAITVGKGGGGAPHTVGNGNNSNIPGTNGVASVLVVGETTLTANGGGGGGSGHYKKQAPSGGCGGGGSAGYAGGSGSQGGNGGTSASGLSNNYPGGGGGGAGGNGGACRSDGTNSGGYGGVGVESDITGEPLFYAGGGGGGSRTSASASGGQGGGGKGGSSDTKKGGDATFYGGGGGGTYNNPGSSVTGGAGYQGIVVVRYSTAKQKNPVVLPEVKGVTYNGELQKADETSFELDKYDVVNEGGTDAGSYPVTFSLKNPTEDEWVDDHSSTNKTLYFVISKAANGWTPQPSLSKTTWESDEEPATVNAGAALSETAVTVTYDEGEDVMPLTIGTHKVVFTVEESQNYLGLSKTISYTINKNTNSWTVEPSLTKTTWTVVDDPGVIVAGAVKYGEIFVTYDNDPVLTELPMSVGAHTVKFTVAEADTYKGLDQVIAYTVTKVPNSWLTEPSMTKTTWAFDEEPGAVVDGVAKHGDVVVRYDDDHEIVELPEELGSHTVKFIVAEDETYTGLEKVVDYTVTKKQHKWTVSPSVPATVNIEDGVSFPMPAAEPGVEVKAYFDGDPEKTELTEIAVGETHTVTYEIAGDDDWDEVKQTFTFKVTYKPIVDQTDPSKVFGYRIPKLGANQDEVALVFTNTGYTADSPMRWTLPQEVAEIDYLVVGGGAAGGMSGNAYGAGGGGAGGVVEVHDVTISSSEISVSVGAGGVALKSVTGKDGNPGGASTLTLDDSPVRALPGAGGTKGNANGLGGASTYACGGGAGGYNSANQYTGGKGAISNGGDAKSAIGGGGGGAGGNGGTAVNAGGPGGEGVGTMIFSDVEIRIAGGGSGSPATRINGPSTDGGGMGAFRDTSYGGPNATSGTSWGAGGGGAHGNACLAGSGHQGVVVVRYVEPEGVVMVPYIAPKTYTGETLVADVPANVGYTVTANMGGMDVGEYDVVLTLNEGYHWNGGSTAPEHLVFAITPAQNEWKVNPSITKATWLTTDEPGVLTNGVTKFGTPTATISKDGGDAESFSGTLPTAAGQYVITYAVETSDDWNDPEVTEQSVSFEIVSGDVVPPFTVTKGETTTVVGDGKVDLSVGYAVHCEVESDKTVDIYAYYAEDGADTTNEVKIAEDAVLDATGTGVIPDLKPGATYWVALGGKGGDTVAPTTEFETVTVTGPATGLAAAATFTNDPKEFVITGSVVPGLGTTTVYLRWSLNSSALDNLATYTFAYGDAGAFTNRVQYVNPTDTLTWDVAVSNSFTSTTHGEQKWDAALPASTKKRTDTVSTVYSWTGAGEDNNWANPANWTANRAESFGYPDNVNYAIAQISKTATINLGGGTYSLVKGGSIWLNANSGDVVTFTNGTIKMAIGTSDTELGAAGATLVFRDATFDRKRMNPVEGATVVVEGASTFTGMIRPKAKAVKIIFRNSENITIGDIFNSNSPDGITGVTVSNALVTVENATVPSTTWTPATFPVALQNGPDRQARLIFRNTQYDNYNKWDFVQSPYTLTIPEQPYATPYLQTAKPAETTSAKPAFNIDVTNWKRSKRVPILTFTQSANGAATQYGGATLRAYENGVNVTTKRNARLEWDEAKRTLYYKQDGQFGFSVIVK